jgi:hypothetical protein
VQEAQLAVAEQVVVLVTELLQQPTRAVAVAVAELVQVGLQFIHQATAVLV